MKNALPWLSVCIVFVACNVDEKLTPPEIGIDVSPVWVGVRSIAEDAPEKPFDLQIRNLGEQTLKIEKVSVKGDQHCAFNWIGPDQDEIGADGSAFIRMTYKPTVRDNDSVSLIIESNAENFDRFIVPICGRGALQEEIDQMAEVDGGVGGEDGPLCSAPPSDQPDCDAEGK